MTVRDLIEKSLRLSGVIGIGENADGSMIDDALDSFKMLCETWSMDAALLPQLYQSVGSFTSNVYNYTVGIGADININTPQKIDQIIVTYLNIRYPLENVDRQRYNEINTTNVQSNIPLYYTYSLDETGKGNISIWPAPLTTLPIQFITRMQSFLQNPANQILDYDLSATTQKGFTRTFMYDLAIEYSTQYGIPADPMIISTASKLKAQFKRQNTLPVKMDSDVFGFVSKRYFNILKG